MATDTDFYGKRFDSIQALRAVSIIFVMLTHIPALGIGAFGVDIFFVISGFMMMYTTHVIMHAGEDFSQAEKRTNRGFLIKRIIRIIPLYYVITIFTYVMILVFPNMFVDTDPNPVYLIKSFFFIPYSIGNTAMPIVRVAWSLNYEILFYLLFFVSLRISSKYRGLICSGILVVLGIIGALFNFKYDFLEFWTGELIIEFAFGIGAYYLCKSLYSRMKAVKERKSAPVIAALLLVFAAFLLFVMIKLGGRVDSFTFARLMGWGIPAFLVFMSVFFAGVLIPVPSFLKRIGDMSFSVYLLHYYPVVLMARVSEGFDNVFMRIGCVIAGIIAAFLISEAGYFLFEKKLHNILYKFLKKS